MNNFELPKILSNSELITEIQQLNTYINNVTYKYKLKLKASLKKQCL